MNLGLESLTTKKRNLIGNVLFSKIGASELQVLHKYSYSMADMHFHPNALFLRGAARDRRYKEIIDSARKMGAGLAVTEHNTISSYLSLSKNKKGVTVIPAMEISCNNRPHFLFYFYSNGELAEFYERHVKPYHRANPLLPIKASAERIVGFASDYNCIVSAAHPFDPVYGLYPNMVCGRTDSSVLDMIDAIEVLNSKNMHCNNLDSIEFAKRIKKPFTAGSDGHRPVELGNALVCSRAHSTESFLSNIIKQKNIILGCEASRIMKIQSWLSESTNYLHTPIADLKYLFGLE